MRDSHSRTNSKSTGILWNFHTCDLEAKPQNVFGSGAAADDACGKDRTGPVLCCVRLCCSQSRHGQQPARTSDKVADRAELSDSKNGETNWAVLKARNRLKHLPPCRNECRICTAELIAAGDGKGARMRSVRLWVKIHRHRRSAVAWALSLVCAKDCGRPQQHWRHGTCGVAVVSLKCATALKSN